MVRAGSFLNRTNLYTTAVVLLLFSVLPLSQRLFDLPVSDTVTVRRVDLAPPPPPPPEDRQSAESGISAQAGINLQSLVPAVNLQSVGTGLGAGLAGSGGLGLGAVDFDMNTHATFTMEGVGFGAGGLDRPPIMIVRPTLHYGYLEKKGIDQFEVLVMVKWNKDGSLTFISIEEIQYPDPELAVMVRDAVSRIRYSRPTVNGEPVERFIRLPLTIYAN